MSEKTAIMVAGAAMAVGLAKILQDDESVEVRRIDVTEMPDLTDTQILREVDIRPAKFHQIINGHPRSFRRK